MSSPVLLVDQLHGLVDRLLAVDVDALGGDELQALVVGLQAERSRLAVAAAEVLHRWEQQAGWKSDGSLRASSALGRDTRSCRRQALAELRRARLLRRMPHVRAAVLAGRLSIAHVDLMVQFAAGARFALFNEHEAELVAQCEGLSLFDDARRLMLHWAALADDLLGRRGERPAPSTLYATRSHDTGELLLDGHLGAVDGEIVESELKRLMHELRLDDRTSGLVRTPAQLRAAALVRMAARSVNAHRPSARPLFQVIIGDDTAARLCQLASGVVVRPHDLQSHLDAAVIESFLFDGPSTVIAKSHRRTFTGALRRAIQVRDRRCQHASVCPTPAVESDIDHRRPAARGGPTSQFNGQVECIPHNRLAHLHDQPEELPERSITNLDAIRCRLRWRVLHDDAHDDPYEPAHGC